MDLNFLKGFDFFCRRARFAIAPALRLADVNLWRRSEASYRCCQRGELRGDSGRLSFGNGKNPRRVYAEQRRGKRCEPRSVVIE